MEFIRANLGLFLLCVSLFVPPSSLGANPNPSRAVALTAHRDREVRRRWVLFSIFRR